MPQPSDHVMEFVTGRWRSQTLYAGVGLGDVSVLREYPKRAVEIVDQRDVDRDPVYRLLRSLGSLESFDGNNETVSHV